ncbi:MAG: hypothetical protein WC870_02905, partial [Candidatus Paceibacterota bacterium]
MKKIVISFAIVFVFFSIARMSGARELSVATDLTSRINAFWGANPIYVMELDSENQVLYLGGGTADTAVKFAKYDIGNDIATDLTANILDLFDKVSEEPILAMDLDSVNNILYFSTGNPSGYPDGPRFIAYDLSSHVATNLTSTISSFWGNAPINAIFVYGNYVYLLGNQTIMGDSSNFARYSISLGTAEDLGYIMEADPNFGVNNLFSYAYDNDHTLYIGAHGQFGAFNLLNDTLTDLSQMLWDSYYNDIDPLWGLTYDEEENRILVAGGARYAGIRQSQSYAIYSINSNSILHSHSAISPLPIFRFIIDPIFRNDIYATGGSLANTTNLFGLITGEEDNVPPTSIYNETISSFWSSDIPIVDSVYNNGSIPGIYLAGFSGEFAFLPLPNYPTVTSSPVTNITRTGATLNGEITATGGADATARGFQYGMTNSYGTTVTESSGPYSTGVFTADLSNLLTCGQPYYFRAYATNIAGTSYGAETTFTTTTCDTGGGGGGTVTPPPVTPPVTPPVVPPVTPPVVPPETPPEVIPETPPTTPPTETPPPTPPVIVSTTTPTTTNSSIPTTSSSSAPEVIEIPSTTENEGVVTPTESTANNRENLLNSFLEYSRNLLSTPLVKTPGIIAVTLPAAVSLLALLAALFSGAPFLNQIFYSLVLLSQLLGFAKKPKPWGTVYDAYTKRPLAFARVEILNEQNRKLQA